MKKVNLGCGNRYAKGWINLDFNSNTTDVISHNLLTPLPFNDNEIDAIYCSHVLEHFSREEGKRLIENCYKKLKFGGILRIVVPDLENICREYLSILENINEDENKKKYEWIIIELLDQLTRNKSGGEMAVFWQKVVENRDDFLIDYIKSRTGTDLRSNKSIQRDITLIDKFKKINFNKIKIRLIYLYLDVIKKIIPRTLRNTVIDNTSIGEKHKWMYDKYSLKELLTQVGFKRVEFLSPETSNIKGFTSDYLDTNPDGTYHKESSIYCEAQK